MTTINLLPWREKKREEDKRYFLLMLLTGLIMACLIVTCMAVYACYYLSQQRHLNELLYQKIALLDPTVNTIKRMQKQKKVLEARIRLIEKLQLKRLSTVRLFDELSTVMITGVVITKLERENNRITLHGTADLTGRISVLMRNIEASHWMTSPFLSEIKQRDMDNNEFTLRFLLKSNASVSKRS